MAGLEDDSSSSQKSFFNRSFTFHGNLRRTIESKKSHPSITDSSKKPYPSQTDASVSLWSQTAKRFSDLNIAFRRLSSSRSIRPPLPPPPSDEQIRRPPGGDDKIVLYFTSLHGIRRTYEDCVAVRSIFRGFMVPVDDRDISMDSAYRRELQAVLEQKAIGLPQVFIRGKHIGGAEEVKQLLESGELRKLLEGFPARDPSIVCRSCGDARFVPCANCSGSRKVFVEEDGQLRRCLNCNENGLVRCAYCCG